jgi:hypothetical protein
MNLPYDLNLAIGYVCLLAILSMTAFWLVPLALRAITAALRELSAGVRTRVGRGRSRSALVERSEDPWWGPHSASH